MTKQEEYVYAVALCIVRESKGIPFQAAIKLAQKGIDTFSDLNDIRETPLALELIEAYAFEKKKIPDFYLKSPKERKAFLQEAEEKIQDMVSSEPDIGMLKATLKAYEQINKKIKERSSPQNASRSLQKRKSSLKPNNKQDNFKKTKYTWSN